MALARIALVFEALERGELVEPFDVQARLASPYSYWVVVLPSSAPRPEVQRFCQWVQERAALTRRSTGEDAVTDP